MEWFRDYWNSKVIVTDIGFVSYEVNPLDLYITHFFISPGKRNTFKQFHDMFRLVKDEGRRLGKKKILTSVDTSTDRWRQILWVDQKYAGFKITGSDEYEYHLEYLL